MSAQPATPLALEHLKQKLKRKAELLDDFILNQSISATEKCEILHRRIDLVKNEISKAGGEQTLRIFKTYISTVKKHKSTAVIPRSESDLATTTDLLPGLAEAANNWLQHAGIETIGGIEDTIRVPSRPVPVDIDPQQASLPVPTPRKRPYDDRRGEITATDALQRQDEYLYRHTSAPLSSVRVAQGLPPSRVPPLSKRIRLSAEDISPCLRCKILKKKCDTLERCAHCPRQSHESGNDYWKAMGCFRGPLGEFSSVFCPDFARSTSRVLKSASGEPQTVEFILVRSVVSARKKKRILHLLRARKDFRELANSSWEDTNTRTSLSKEAGAMFTLGEDDLEVDDIPLEDYEPAWALMLAVAMDKQYQGQTEYNAFELLRLGNKFSAQDPSSPWEIFRKAKRLLRQAVEIYLLESLCRQIALGTLSGPPPFDPTRLPASKALVLVDIKADMEAFLEEFDLHCSRRARLTGSSQLPCFYALLVFSIAKSLLIDAYSIRSISDYANPWNESCPIQINSVFKALASVFTWSSKSDMMLQDDSSMAVSHREAVRESREMVRGDQWKKRGFHGTKDFLLSLGCFTFGSSYNGFFTQAFGLDAVPKHVPSSPSIRGIDRLRHSMSAGKGEKNMMHTFKVSPSSAATPRRDQSPSSPSSSKTLSPSPHTSVEICNGSILTTSSSDKTGNAALPTFTFVGHHEVSNREHCRRRGALDEATLKKSREVRKIGACWNCWLMKVPCSEGDPCDRCTKVTNRPPLEICSRVPLTAHAGLFFPGFLNSYLEKARMDTYISNNVSCFTTLPRFRVEIKWFGDAPLGFLASTFIPNPQAEAQDKYHARSGQPLGVESLPVGFLPSDEETVEKTCLAYLESLLEEHSLPDMLSRYRSSLWGDTITAICQLYKSTKHPLLHDILLFHLTVHIIGRAILFTDASAVTITERLESDYTDSKFYSSRLLNRQIKRVIYLASRKILEKALGQLEKILRGRKYHLWPICFSTITTLCLCIEEIQIRAELHLTSLRTGSILPEDPIEEPEHACGSLEKFLNSHLTQIFHSIYGTNGGGINPLQGNASLRVSGEEFENAEVDMIQTFRIILDDGILLQGRSTLLDSNSGPHELAKTNSGRLVAKFMQSFAGQRSRSSSET